jgi:DNA polymerase-1
MKIIRTDLLTPETMPTSDTEKLWIYNGLDCCVTAEVLDVIKPQLDNQTRSTYEFEKALQGPVLEMKLRGLLVDEESRWRVVREYEDRLRKIESNLVRILKEGLDVTLNWRSPAQLLDLFYTVLRLPPIKKRNSKGVYAPTVDREALERLDAYFYAQPIVSHLLALRDISKKIGVLKTSIDPDGRMRTSYNIAGTTTGRFSSSLSDFGTGTNLQNIEQRLRSVFVADPGYKFAYIDLEQAESRAVGAIEWNLFHDGRYLDACESGDLHTTVCRLAWTDLPWTGDIRRDREVAEQPFYRQHSYRHMAKVLGHGTNYNGKPYTMAKHTKLEANLIAAFQSKYFAAFPAHQQWHAAVAKELYLSGRLDTLTGRRRWFFGRRDDDTTIREAIAFGPQGSVGDILNAGMLAVWRLNCCQLLLQIHDAILIQYPENLEAEILEQVLPAITVPIELRHNRTLTIPSEAKVGWTWADATEANPDGLVKWKGAGSDKRHRQRYPALGKLDRVLARV